MKTGHPRGITDDTWLAGLCALYSLPADFSLARLAAFYTADAVFIDPVHEVHGLPAMQRYFEHSYARLLACQFVFLQHASAGDNVFINWQMNFRHPRLRNGTTISVPGCSHLQLRADRICQHRDYYDAGSMLYEHIPLLGSATRWIKRKLVP